MFMKKLVLSALLSGILAPFAHAQTTQVVDNQDPGFSITAGTWVSSASIGGFIGDNYLNTGDTTSFNQVQWELTTTDGSNYDVAARWTAFGNRTSRATYSITHANGVTQVTVNQRVNGGEFVSLGVFESPTLVQLSNDGIDGFVVADAIQAQPTGGETTGSASINLDACFGDEYFDDGTGLVKYDPTVHTDIDSSTQFVYRGEELISHLYSNSFRSNIIYIRNISDHSVNFFYEPTLYNQASGQIFTVGDPALDGVFNSSNTPTSSAGAIMPPHSAARLRTGTISNSSAFYGEAKIYWQTSECLSSAPMMTSSEVIVSTSSVFAVSAEYINDGNPW